MKSFSRAAALVVLLLPAVSFAQAPGGGRTVEVRAILNDPVHPAADIQVETAPKVFNKLQLAAEGFAQPVKVNVSNNALNIYGLQGADTKVPPPVLGTTPLPASIQRCMVVISPLDAPAQPAAGGEVKAAYRLVVIDDSPNAFPFGESRIVNMTKVQLGLEAGKLKLALPPEKITNLPPVKDVNDYNVAQTNFYAVAGDKLVPFTERQLQYVNTMRRVFIVYVTPGSIAPAVRTVADYEPAAPPRAQ